MLLSAQDIAEATGGRWTPAPPEGRIESVSTDTRSITAGDLFVALRGENFDAHRFLKEAVASGAAAVVVDGPQSAKDLAAPALHVRDTLRALGDIAAAWRAKCPARRAAVVGSTGKTTTKNMLGAILAAAGPTLATEGNLNNLIGVPQTLFGLSESHRFAVIEMGMNEPGELERLTKVVDPDVLVFLGVGTAHIGQFGSLDGLLDAKGEALRGLRPDATVVHDTQSPNTRRILARWLSDRRATGFAVGEEAGVWSDGVEALPEGDGYGFDVHLPEGDTRRVRLHAFGRYNVVNATAAAAAAWEMGVDGATIVSALEGFRAESMRSQARDLAGRRVIADCYNANPESMRAAVESAREWAGDGRLVLVLGEMLELGDASGEAHAVVADLAMRAGAAMVLAMGAAMKRTVDRVRLMGGSAEWFDAHEALAHRLDEATKEGDTVLFKGSRGNRLEKIIEAWEALAADAASR